MNNNNINFQVHRTTEGTLCEAISGVLLLLSLIFSIIVMQETRQGGTAMLIQTGICGFCVVLVLVLAYAPNTFNIPDDSPAELFIATIRFLRITALMLSIFSLSLTLSAMFSLNPTHLSAIFGLAFVPLLCWYFYVYIKSRHKRNAV